MGSGVSFVSVARGEMPRAFFCGLFGRTNIGARFSGIGGFGEEKRTELRCMRFSLCVLVILGY